jgi:hypothetical protein
MRALNCSATPAANRRDRLNPQAISEKCYGAFATAGGPNADKALGIVAHILIEQDYEQALNVTRGDQLFVDDQFAGSVNPRYARFILERNGKLDPKARERIRKGGYRRPDVLLHDLQLHEFEEIKSDSETGRAEGQRQVIEIRNWMRSVGLDYDFGMNYSPNGRALPIVEFRLVGVPVNVCLRPQRAAPGLIVYRYCFRTDWGKLKKMFVVAAFLALLVYLLSQVGIPGPLPNPMPVPIPVIPDPTPVLPPPDPIRQPIAPPVREPITPGLPPADQLRQPIGPPVRDPITNEERLIVARSAVSNRGVPSYREPSVVQVMLSTEFQAAMAALRDRGGRGLSSLQS